MCSLHSFLEEAEEPLPVFGKLKLALLLSIRFGSFFNILDDDVEDLTNSEILSEAETVGKLISFSSLSNFVLDYKSISNDTRFGDFISLDTQVQMVARCMGFCVRKEGSSQTRGNAYIFVHLLFVQKGWCKWVCSRSGHPSAKIASDKRQRSRLSLKCGCMRFVKAIIGDDNANWIISGSCFENTQPCRPSTAQQILAERARGFHH